ncbi:MAG: hypothetical protein Q9227_005178 [Pyrenula ochraceoflavens]
MNELTEERGSDKDDALTPIRKFYYILIQLSLCIAFVNILQVALLGVIINTAWIIVPPVVILTLFIGRLIHHVMFDQSEKFEKFWEAWRGSTRWERLARLGVLLNVVVNIVLVEFVYLNGVAIPGFKSFTWKTSLEPTTSFQAPSIALIQEVGNHKRGSLPQSNTALTQFCKMQHNLSKNQRCVQTFYKSDTQWGTLAYSIFNGASFGPLKTGTDLDLLYGFQYNPVTSTPMLGLAAFDSTFSLSDFSAALNCGLITWGNFPAGGRAQLAIEQTLVSDDLGAFNRTAPCPGFTSAKKFSSYRTVPLSLVPWKADTACKTRPADEEGESKYCNGDIDVYFSSGLVTVQTSGRGKDWVGIFIDEGSIVGGVSFVIWFLGIYVI